MSSSGSVRVLIRSGAPRWSSTKSEPKVSAGPPAETPHRSAEMTQVKASEAIIFKRKKDKLIGYNFLQSKEFQCSNGILEMIGKFSKWITVEKNIVVQNLLDFGIIIEKNSSDHILEKNFKSGWEWGDLSAAFHFSLNNREYLPVDKNTSIQQSKIENGQPPPPAFLRNNDKEIEIVLQRPSSNLIDIMRNRRSVRNVGPTPIPLPILSQVLYAGMAITGFTHNGVCELPLKMTPSGGARNPYEAYVLARKVDGLSPGVYHYSAVDHALGRITDHLPENFSELIGGQDWADQMPCVIFLCAFMERTMWKYCDSNSYRVILVEAGHIGQNMMLAGTEHGFTICPTAAISHTRVSELLELDDPVRHTPVYCLAMGKPRDDSRDAVWSAI